jgi:hypothetical protein
MGFVNPIAQVVVEQTKQISCGENGVAAHVQNCWVLELGTGVFAVSAEE